MNVFISRPTIIDEPYEIAYAAFHQHLSGQGFNLCRLGGSYHSKQAPLLAVIDLINDSCGMLVLGYPQLEFRHVAVRSTKYQNQFQCVFPTPWNQIEGALAYACRAPVLVVACPGIAGGVFDHGTTGESVLHIDLAQPDWFLQPTFAQPFSEWLREVKNCAGKRVQIPVATGT